MSGVFSHVRATPAEMQTAGTVITREAGALEETLRALAGVTNQLNNDWRGQAQMRWAEAMASQLAETARLAGLVAQAGALLGRFSGIYTETDTAAAKRFEKSFNEADLTHVPDFTGGGQA